MCGLVGYFTVDGEPVNGSDIKAMLSNLRHRGPDDTGIAFINRKTGIIDNGCQRSTESQPYDCILGFNRLSILDLSLNGHQPMINAQQSVALTFNGEIYNASEYRDVLQRKGYTFKSQTDTEVILNLYDLLGFNAMLEKLNGMFSIVLYDRNQGAIYLARDRYGIKPLYYYTDKNIVLYASEVKAFFYSSYFSPHLWHENLEEQFIFGYISGDETLLRNVHTVQPGTYVTFNRGGYSITQYRDLDKPLELYSGRYAAQKALTGLLANSVISQLQSDVDVGFQLSGGIDSSLITRLALQSNRIHQSNIHAISITLNDEKLSEERWIDIAVRGTSIETHKYLLDTEYFFKNLQVAAYHSDFPLIIPNTLGIFLLAQKAKQYFTVCLSGEGADELFGGYHRFLYGTLFDKLYFIVKNRYLRQKTQKFYIKGIDHYMPMGRATRLDEVNEYILWSSGCFGVLPFLTSVNLIHTYEKRKDIIARADGNAFKRFQYYEMKTHLVGLLERQDKMTMAHSIENRVPFLDNDVVRYAREYDARLCVDTSLGTGLNSRKRNKRILKSIASTIFDEEFVYRKKSGFALPLKNIFHSKEFYSLFNDELMPSMKRHGIFDHQSIQKVFFGQTPDAGINYEILWKIIAFELWFHTFFENGNGYARKAS